MNSPLDPETLKIPAFLRKKAIVSQARQKLILTALDRKEAGLSPKSKKALAPMMAKPRKFSPAPRRLKRQQPNLDQDYGQNYDRPAPPQPQNFPSKKLPAAGIVTHFLDNLQVAIIKLSAALQVGDSIIIEGEDYLFLQPIEEMQIDRKPITKAKKGSHIGLKVLHPAKVKGNIYRVA